MNAHLFEAVIFCQRSGVSITVDGDFHGGCFAHDAVCHVEILQNWTEEGLAEREVSIMPKMPKLHWQICRVTILHSNVNHSAWYCCSCRGQT